MSMARDGIRSMGGDFRVAIVGGGICGLVAAIGLNKAGIRVDIYESAVCRRLLLRLIKE